MKVTDELTDARSMRIATEPIRTAVAQFVSLYGADRELDAWQLIADRTGYKNAASARDSVPQMLERAYVESGRLDFDAIGWTDALLCAIDAVHLWPAIAEAAPPAPGRHCEDCGKGPLDEDDYRPLDLMRPDPSASSWVWDSTKGKPVHRPRNARVGGRRFRLVDLCRRCAGEALRQRAAKSGTVMENGKRRVLKTRERVAPKRGGRPRLLDERQLRQLHELYEREGLSINDLATALADGGKVPGTRSGLYQSILYGWRKLGLPLRDKATSQALAHHRRGRIPAEKRRCPATTAKGKPCCLGPKAGMTHCVSHQHLEAVAA